jgi:hypothetical protein
MHSKPLFKITISLTAAFLAADATDTDAQQLHLRAGTADGVAAAQRRHCHAQHHHHPHLRRTHQRDQRPRHTQRR